MKMKATFKHHSCRIIKQQSAVYCAKEALLGEYNQKHYSTRAVLIGIALWDISKLYSMHIH